MKIANPIYDSVFKYLLDDNQVAKVFLSNILGVKIDFLQLEPTEKIVNSETRNFTVFRIDFKATITLENHSKQVVLIEIQKAKLDTDILRFRKYLGAQYLDENNTYPENPDKALPIYTIYFLGHELEHSQNSPIINVNREYIDNYSKEKLSIKEEFIESLTHNSIVVQIPLFKKYRRNRLEKLLSLFEASTRHEIDADELEDEDYKLITRRLLSANSDTKVKMQMDVEDEIFKEFEKKDRAIAESLAQVIEYKEQLIDVKLELGETQTQLGETQTQLGETQAMLTESLQREEKADAQKIEAIKLLISLGVSNDIICNKLQVTKEEIEKLRG